MLKQFSKGFTIMEIMVAILILGILTSMAVPKLNIALEQFRSKEGVQILHTVLQGQLNADADVAEARIASYTLATLDVTIPAADFFNVPVLNWNGATMTTATVTINGVAYPYHASIQRTTGVYTIYVQGFEALNSKAGRILCAPQTECTMMKYCPWRPNC